MTLSQFKDGFSMIPLPTMEMIADDFGIRRDRVMFRRFSDAVATKVYYHPWRRRLVMQIWPHCFGEVRQPKPTANGSYAGSTVTP